MKSDKGNESINKEQATVEQKELVLQQAQLKKLSDLKKEESFSQDQTEAELEARILASAKYATKRLKKVKPKPDPRYTAQAILDRELLRKFYS